MANAVNNNTDKRFDDLAKIIHFTEAVSAKIYGILDPSLILKTIANEFQKSNKYNSSIMLLTEDGSRIKLGAVSINSKIMEKGERAAGIKTGQFSIQLNKTRYYRQVIREEKTILVKTISLVEDIISKPLAYIIRKIFHYKDEVSILTPLYKNGRVIGSFSTTAPEMAEYFIPTVKNLSQHITIALELADENARRQHAEKRAVDILEGMGEAIMIFDLEGKIIQVNTRLEKGIGLKRKDIIGKKPIEIGLATPEQGKLIENEILPRLMRENHIFDIEATSTRKDGKTVPVSMNFSLLKDGKGKPVAIINVAKNIAKLKAAEAAIKDFSRKMITVREEEKKKVSTELHDEIGTMVMALNTSLSLAENEIRQKNTNAALDRVKQTKQSVIESVETLKKIAVDLRPPQLDIIGLPEALREYFSHITRNAKIKINFAVNLGRLKISDAAATALYRIAQEALNNVVQHAKAKKVKVNLWSKNSNTVLTIKDDGQGFNPEKVLPKPKAIGIIGMKERTESLKGNFTIKSRIKKGTEIKAVLPV